MLTFSCGLLYEKVPAAGAADYRTDWPWGVVTRRPAALTAGTGGQQRDEFHDRQPRLPAAGKPGRIIARPQSGYYVAPQPIKQRQPEPPAQVTRDESVDINTYIFEVLQASRQASMLPFASAFPIRACFRCRSLTALWRRSAKPPPP